MSNPQSAIRNPQSLVRPLVRQLHAYVPGEQPKIRGLIKLNTNENPYPPSPRVLAAIKRAVDGRLRLYPNPAADALRAKLAKHHGCAVDNLIVGNGSDELLEMAVRGFVEPIAPLTPALSPSDGARVSAGERPLSTSPAPSDGERVSDLSAAARGAQAEGRVKGIRPGPGSPGAAPESWRSPGSVVQYFTPSYSLYPVLADMHGAAGNAVPLQPDFSLPSVAQLRRGGQWNFRAALTLVTTPNAPTGKGYPTADLETLCRAQRGVVVLDETYVDFANEHALALALKLPHVIVSRTFSKAYSLCFQRVGYFVGHPILIAALHKIRDSYNVNGLGQVAAEATLDDLGYYRRNFRRVIATRQRVAAELTRLGFQVCPSQTNFLFVRPPRFRAEQWLGLLRERRVLVRWFAAPEVRDYLRVSIGTDGEMDIFLQVVRAVLRRS